MDVRTPIPTNGGDWLARFGETWTSQVAQLKAKFGDQIEEIRMPGVDPTDVPIVYFKKSAIIEALRLVKSDPVFDYSFLSDITATDEMPSAPRFEIVYNLRSLTRHNRIRFKVRVNDGESVPTATKVWPAANWPEREVFDMFGVRFEGHPDLRRILMDVRWQGHPLRKDYPLRGYQIFPTPEPADLSVLEKGDR